jgi:polyhydroxyalkanoate synthesis regulator phasin
MKKFCGDKKVGQIPSYKHVLEVIQRLAKEKREIHTIYHKRKLTLSFRLSNIAFSSEVHLVIQWLEEHGEPYLRKKVGIGENVQQAKSLQKNHMGFRAVAQNTHSNAQQLFDVATRLVASGECNIEQTNSAAEELKRRIQTFDTKVELRTKLLHLSVLFHIHYGEIMNWYEHLDKRNVEYETIGAMVEACEERQERFMCETDGTAQV